MQKWINHGHHDIRKYEIKPHMDIMISIICKPKPAHLIAQRSLSGDAAKDACASVARKR